MSRQMRLRDQEPSAHALAAERGKRASDLLRASTPPERGTNLPEEFVSLARRFPDPADPDSNDELRAAILDALASIEALR